jgi:glyoxylase-like metal-dependent hydrolase (beta-lactamase superfamily II)
MKAKRMAMSCASTSATKVAARLAGAVFDAPLLAATAFLAFAALLACGAAAARPQEPFMSSPVISADAQTKQVSPHVWMITAFPNIGIVVGDRATLVVDTGLGARNGEAIAHIAQKLSKPGARLYLTTTHFHPEHAGGDQGFPAGTIIIRDAAQQKELEAMGDQMVTRFSGMNTQFAELLKGHTFRPADIVFDREVRVDLGGGVSARLLWYGGAHTMGDELTFVEPDDALISGDVVQNKVSPNIAGGDSTFKSWRAVVEQVQKLPVKIVVPDHSAVGDASLVTQELAFLTDLVTLTARAKSAGKSVDDAAQSVAAEMKQKYPDWRGTDNLPNLVKRAYGEN